MTSSQKETHHRENAIREIVETHESQLIAYAYRITGDVHTARDVVQDTFIRYLRQLERDPIRDIKAWLFRTCRNRALDIMRKVTRFTSVDHEILDSHEGHAPHPAHGLEKAESHRSLTTLLESLPEKQQEVIRLKFLHELSYRQISEVTSLSESNIGFLIHTGIKTLRGKNLEQRQAFS